MQSLTLGWSTRILITKFHVNLVDATFPMSSFLAGNSSLPRPASCGLGSIIVGQWLGPEINGMVAAPQLALFAETSLGNR